LPIVFVDDAGGFGRSDFLHVDSVAFESFNHLAYAGDVLGGTGLEPRDAHTKRVRSAEILLFRALAEASSQLVQLVGVEAVPVSP
jgi:hypothetical protein